jgi:hypothetical protein
VITEMRNTTFRQPEWYRYVAAVAGEKDVVVVENPYGGVVPELVELLKKGRGYDLFRLSLYEGAAFGINMTVPYGAWMGSTIEDSFHPPHELAVEVQTFLADHEALYSKESWHELAVVYSVSSTRDLIAKADASDNIVNARDASVRVPYRVATEALSTASVPFDVLVFSDGETAPDRIDPANLTRYRTVVLPDCFDLTDRQAKALTEALEAGTTLVVTDRFGESLGEEERQALLRHPGVTTAAAEDVTAMTPHGPQVRASAPLGVNVHRVEDGAAVHVVNFDVGPDGARRTGPVILSVRLGGPSPGPVTATYLPADGEPVRVQASSADGVHEVSIPDVGVYGVLQLTGVAR